jgi:hypothetical protein
MKIRAITMTNIRSFIDTARIENIGDGLNVLCEANEFGKSTLFDAIQALFFKAHGSKDKDIKALQPHAGGAPEVAVDVETLEGRFTISKRWMSKPFAQVHQEGRLVAQADAAEEWITRLIGGGDGGPSGLVWVRQGITDLNAGSKKEQDAGLEARRDLISSVTGEVEAMTGGRRMDTALARCREELETYATGKNRNPRKGGPWKDAQDKVAELETSQAAHAATAQSLHDALATRKRLRRELAELTDPETDTGRQQRLENARTAFAAAERHAESVDLAARQLEAARSAANTAQARLEGFRAVMAEQEAAQKAAAEAETDGASGRATEEQARTSAAKAQSALDAAQTALSAAEDTRRLADRQQAARDGAERRQDLLNRIEQADRVRQSMEDAAAAAKIGPDATALRKLEGLATALASSRAVRDAAAPQLRMTYETGVAGRVTLNGAALADGTQQPLNGASRIGINGIGTLDIWPGEDDSAEAVNRSERALQSALGALDFDSLDAARQAAELRNEAEQRRSEAEAVLKSLAPDGVDKLREALARIPVPVDMVEAPSPAEAEAAWEAAAQAYSDAKVQRETAVERHSDARSRLAAAETAFTAAKERLDRANAALAQLGTTSLADLESDLSNATENLGAAERALKHKKNAAPDIAAAQATLKRAQSVVDGARAEVDRLRPEIAMLDERIARGSGEAIEERLAETEQQLVVARERLSRIEHEVRVLIRLETALEAARAQARERYFAPVAAELKPLLQLLWPDSELTWGQDTLLPEALIRRGASEPIEILSGGTREQIALLVRLAFARMLAKDGRHAPVILDDALVFTDDDRIERMFDALHRQAGDLQILVLTCRQRAFRDLGGRALHLAAPNAAEKVA